MKALGSQMCMKVMDCIIEYIETGTLHDLDGDALALFEDIRRTIDNDRVGE